MNLPLPILILETLTDLFLSDLLRPDCKLRSFDQQPLSLLAEMSSGNVMTRKRFLCRWLFEDKLKTLYSQFISAIDAVSRDTVDMHRERAVTAMYKLLAGNPEQEVVSFSFSSIRSMIQIGIRSQLQFRQNRMLYLII